MTGWEVQEMEETARNRQWEELCELRENDQEYTAAAKELALAIDKIGLAMVDVECAAGEVTGLPEYDRVVSFLDDIEKLKAELQTLKDKIA